MGLYGRGEVSTPQPITKEEARTNIKRIEAEARGSKLKQAKGVLVKNGNIGEPKTDDPVPETEHAASDSSNGKAPPPHADPGKVPIGETAPVSGDQEQKNGAAGSKNGSGAETSREERTDDTKDRASQYANLLDGAEELPPPRLPQDFRDGKLSLGVRLKGTAHVVLSDRTILTADKFGATDYGLTSGPLSNEGIKRFLNGEFSSGAELITRLEAFINRFVLLPKDAALLVAVWIVGTYLYQAFEYFPYLVLRSPEKRCGKTRLLDVIALLAFNAHQPTASPTEAQIFREPREDGGVQIYDELEGMTHDRERWSAITSVFNVGFHRGAVVSRYKKVGGNQAKEVFETYVPRIIASISALEATLEDRALMLFLQRKPPKAHLDRFSPRHLSKFAQAFRDACAAFALARAATIEECYRKGNFSGLADLDDDRAVNLWEPLIAITSVADAESGDAMLTERLVELAGRIGTERAALASDEPIVGILECLRDCLGESPEKSISTSDLIGKVKERLGWESLSPKSLSMRLHPLGLHPSKWREGKTTVRGYDVKKKTIDELMSRYVPHSKGEKAPHKEHLTQPAQV